jgi:hypothetical protein
MPTVFLYSFKEYVQLLQFQDNPQLVNWPMTIYDTKLYKGVTNNIDFVVRNNERRPINLVGVTMEATIQNQLTGEVVLTKSVEITVALQGKARLVLDPGETQDLDAGYYNYTIQNTDINGINQVFYTDVNQSGVGSFELIDGVLSTMIPATEILAAQFTQTPIGNNQDIMFVTGSFPGDAQTQRANGMHTVSVYQSRFLGKFWIQASLTNNNPMPSEWFFVPLQPGPDPMYTFDITNNQGPGPTLFNFNLNAYWVRFGYIPIWSGLVGSSGEYYPITVDEVAQLVVNDGQFISVLYKN